ncbi:MAG TPA: IclR family transcriptional regulator [Trebonia sp.]|jgi:IclR family acetate operon transcriptional repressor|nr:IclR family transcriptional regulator [Trebonia sp.]
MPEAGESTGRGTATRSFRVLQLLLDSERDSLGVREMAAALRLPPSSVHRLLGMLHEERLVARNPDGSYRLGLEFLRLAWKATARFPLATVARPVLDQLAEQTDESALLSVYDADRQLWMFALAVESRHPLRYHLPMNVWVPLHNSASGFAIAAFLPAEQQDASLAANDVAEPDKVRAELAAIAARGYAVSRGQRVHGAAGVAAPIFDAVGQVAGAVALSIPDQRFSTALESELGPVVQAAAAEVTQRIGGER